MILINERGENLRLMKKKNNYYFIAPAIIVLMVVLAIPLGYSFVISFFDTNLKTQGLGNFVGISNYVSAIQDQYFVGSIGTTAYFTIMVVALEFLLGLAIALLLNVEVKGKQIYFSLIIVPMMITPVAVGLIWKLLLHSELGIVNYILEVLGMSGQAWLATSGLAMTTVIFIDVWQNIPYMVLVILAGLATLPQEPYEAATVDGASTWQRFTKLTIPMMSSHFMVVILMRSITALKTYDLIYILTKGGPGVETEVISYYIYQEAFRNLEIGQAAAMSYLLVLIIAPIAFIFIKVSKNNTQ